MIRAFHLDVPTRTIYRFSVVAAALLFASGASRGQQAAPAAVPAPATQEAKGYEPARGQRGKDVVWIPTPEALVTRMLKLAQVTPRDVVVDLGSGDGRIVIAAAKESKAKALGLEFDEKLVAHARRRAEEAGISTQVEFRQADIFTTDFSHADVVTMYLLPDLNLRLRPTLLAMKPGTRLVSHQFTLGTWQPDETSWIQGRPAYLWIVPANTGGTWQARYPGRDGVIAAELSLEQEFQKISGALEIGGLRTRLRNPQVEGSAIGFGFTDTDGIVRRVQANVSGNRMEGTISGLASGGRFEAERRGPVPPLGGSAPASTEELSSAMRLLGE